MLRRLHAVPALAAGLVVMFMAVTGAILSVQPVADHFADAPGRAEVTVASLAEAASRQIRGIERITRSASGTVVAYSAGDEGTSATLIDPETGLVLGHYAPSPVFAFFTELHRSLFMGMNGRLVSGIAALAVIVLSLSGFLLLARRLGGRRQLLRPAKGTLAQRLHVELSRLAVVGLLLTGFTGGVMSLSSFEVINTETAMAAFPAWVDGGAPAPVGSLPALASVPVSEMRELIFPYPDDPEDVFTLTTAAGQGYVDQATGELLAFTPNSFGQSVYETIYSLHTGQGLWWVGALLGLASLAVPALAATGGLIWWTRRRSQPRIARNASPHRADTVILVGSEGNSTWGVALTLHRALTAAGLSVHTAAMNDLARNYPSARRLLVLAATYGDGAAPASGGRFLSRLARFSPRPDLAYAVLGFGDRSFTRYCRFAEDVERALAATGIPALLPFTSVDRQSPQVIAQWGQALGTAIGQPVVLEHVPALPRTSSLVLVDRQDFAMEVQAPTAVLRFAPESEAQAKGWQRLFGWSKPLAFEPGDLLAIVPPGSQVPRYYSIASSSRDGEVEICVRKLAGGLCSEYLHGLERGCRVAAFVKTNPAFRPQRGRAPVILVGAGTGIAPLAGFIRGNRRRRPVHLYFGGRDPASDFLYRAELEAALADRRLASLSTAFSRVVGGGYVQDRLRADSAAIRELVVAGAQIMVCGGREMAQGVSEALDQCLGPLGHTVAALRANGRYLEDVY